MVNALYCSAMEALLRLAARDTERFSDLTGREDKPQVPHRSCSPCSACYITSVLTTVSIDVSVCCLLHDRYHSSCATHRQTVNCRCLPCSA